MKTQLQRLCLALAAAAFLAGCDASINAPVEIEDGTKEASGRSTVNGSIHVGDDVTVTSGAFRSVNGSARIGSRSFVPSVTLVNGDLAVRRPRGVDTSDTVPVIVIGPEVKVVGSLTFEREVKLQIHRGAETGEIVGATPEYIDG